MHYSVIVIGEEEVENQLSPYCENLTEPDRIPATEEHYFDIVSRYGIAYTSQEASTLAQDYGYEEAEVGDQQLITLISHYNTDGRWDWWTVGGRWSGALSGAVDAASCEGTKADRSTLGEVRWNEEMLKAVHSLLVDGDWHDLDHGRDGPPEVSIVEQFNDIVAELPPSTPVTLVDCHI